MEVPFTPSLRRSSFPHPDGRGNNSLHLTSGCADRCQQLLSCHRQWIGEEGRGWLVAMARKIDLRNALYVVNGTVSSFNKCIKNSFVFCSQVYVLIL